VPATSRHRARQLALQGLYAEEIGESTTEQILDTVIADDELTERVLEFARHLFARTRENKVAAEEIVAGLASNWKLDRIALIDLIILRMAITEIAEMPDVPIKVVLDEAIELAKEFSTSDSSAFVNGILDSHIKNLSGDSRV